MYDLFLQGHQKIIPDRSIMQETIQPICSSFRDPSGFVFEKDGIIYRQVNKIFKEDFDHFINSGCYDHLVKNQWLIPHEEIKENLADSTDWYRTLKPQRILFISYAYEWCFDMLRDAALLTLRLAKECTQFGIILKDATPFNIQWLNGKPIFIDTLSFERYDPVKPWIAYRQFCENFLSPLLLMHYSKQPLQSLLLAYPDGIPLSITRSLMPWKSKFSFHTYLHIHMHERLSSKSIGKEMHEPNNFSENKLHRLLDSLQSLIQSLHWKEKATAWNNYYKEAGERDNYLEEKKNIIAEWLKELPKIKTAIDLGANDGEFSFLLNKDISVISSDLDHEAINKLYHKANKENGRNILPLLIDLANPSPALGLNNNERSSFIKRIDCDLGLALALVHHLAIGKNIPLEKIAELLAMLTNHLIVEFIPKQDEKVQLMLKQKKDIYNEYNKENFENAFQKFFVIKKNKTVANSGRILYLMNRHV